MPIVLFGQALQKITGIALAFILARLLGADDYGAYTTLTAFLLVLVTLSSLGMAEGALRALSILNFEQNHRQSFEYYCFLVFCTLAISCAIGVLWYMLLPYFVVSFLPSPSFLYGARLIFLCAPLWAISLISASFVQSMHRYRTQQIILNIRGVILIALVAMIALGDVRFTRIFDAFIIANIVTAVVSVGICIHISRPYLRGLRLFQIPDKFRTMLRLSFFVMANNLCWVVLSSVDRLIIAGLANFTDVAIYTLCATLAVNVLIGVTAIEHVASPLLAVAHDRQQHTELHRHYHRYNLLGVHCATFLGIALLANTEFLFHLIRFDPVAAKPVLEILVIAQFVASLSGMAGKLFIVTGQEKNALLASVLQVGGMILADIVLVPAYGAIGAAVAVLLSTIIGRLYMHWVLYRRYAIAPISPDIVPSLVAVPLIYMAVIWLSEYAPWEISHINIVAMLALMVLHGAFSLVLLRRSRHRPHTAQPEIPNSPKS